MNNDTVTAILWTLVAVMLVLWFTGLVAKATDEQLWSHPAPTGPSRPYLWRSP